ncbi:interferon-induced very large GTPase 1-like [Mytilus trossulus]|uniref:interferon-induced very large GTPase 1-like n=1 Tax=Mytilus trossulus TaxID=6551 RepID=UPI003006A8EC
MDEYLQWKYIRATEEIACLKEKARLYINKIVFRVYYGTAIEDLIRDIKDETERVFKIGNILEIDSIADMNIILTADEDGFECNDFEITEEIYSSPDGKHSLLIDLEVSNDVLRTDDIFQESIGGFMENIITKTNGKQLFPEKEVKAIVLPGDSNQSKRAQCRIKSSEVSSEVSASFQKMYLDQQLGNDKTCKSETELLSELGLEMYYPDKIALFDIVKIQPSNSNIKLSNIPWVFLENIISLNYNARDKILEEQLEHSKCVPDEFDILDNLLGSDALLTRVNPIDLTVAIFNCCSPVVKQIVASKMFMCRLAIPFVFPQCRNEAMVVSIWPIRQIVIERELSHIGAVDCPCNVVSFVRIGYTSVSKSKMINEIISDQYHCTFFNKDSPLGSTTRWISNGLVEMAWYIPSKNSRLLSNETACLNLRGDCDVHRQQFHFLSHFSDAIVIMVDIDEMRNERFMQLTTEVYKTNVMVIISIDAKRCSKGVLRNELNTFLDRTTTYKDRTRIHIMAVEGHIRSCSVLKKEMRNNISELVSKRSLMSLWQRVQADVCEEMNLDENKIVYSAMKEAADQITSFIPNMSSSIKAQLLPLQGEPLKEWSQNLKTVNKSSKYKTIQENGLIRNKMIEARQTQFHICENLGPFMSMFIDKILQILPYEKETKVFVVWLKMFFDERSQHIIPEYLERYKSKWQELKYVQDQKDSKATVDRLQHQLSKREYELAEASFGLEHLCREMGQMYEAMMESNLPTPVKYQTIKSSLPHISAKLLLMGHPFEVMDGDTAIVPLLWVKAVLKTLRESIGDKKLLALSVLGIQSSGKSTLLNAMFGLQFAVGTGRCTRGVFMQLVPVADNTKAYDYVLVIDTEGLRAPELAHAKRSHDNELATFVVGLGDVTIVNVKGDNTAEVEDVLQIVVHAFLRLKLANDRLNLKQKCVFVHQNVSAPNANDKLTQQRTCFVRHLDEMTQAAATVLNIADINSFRQVIDFDSEKNVWYFSDLWYGDPPMAPVNPGYSSCVNRVKDALLFGSSLTQRETYFTITDTISRIEDLWNGILKDDFVFSFRNSLEVKAYNSMERQYQSLTWALEKYVLEFVRSEAKSLLVNCLNDHELEKAFLKIVTQVASEIEKQVKISCNELDSFVERSTLKDVMMQWTESKKNSLILLIKKFVLKAKSDISNIKEEIKIQRLKSMEKTNHEMKINELARNLAVKMQGTIPEREKLEETFNHFWSSWINQLGIKDDIEFVSIADQIEHLLFDKFPSDAAFLMQERSKADLSHDHLTKLVGSISLHQIKTDHFSRLATFWEFGKENSDKCRNQIVDIVNQTFRKIDSMLLELDSQDISFDISYVTEIMNIIVNDIDDHNDHTRNSYRFNFLPPFRAMIVNHVAVYVSFLFTKLNERYNKKHSPKGQMESYKGTAFALFINLVEQKTEDVIAAGFFKEAMIKAVVEHVTELLPIDVQENILVLFGNAKFSLMKDIMVYLANAEKYEEYVDYIHDPTTFAKSWITKLTNDVMFERKGNVETKYAYLAKSRVHKIFSHLLESIQEANENCFQLGQSNVKHWIANFMNHVGESNYLPLSNDILIHVQSRKVSDINNFTEMVLDALKDTESIVLKNFQTTIASTVQWNENPIPQIMNRLWGCEAKCMFCYEPCKNTDSDHIRLGFPHQCIQHRPMGIRGFAWAGTDKFIVDFCNYSITTEKTYKWHENDKKEEWKYYKDYKESHKDWDILPSSDVSKYWMWVVCKYQQEFAEMYGFKLPDIPAHWWSITKETAIESISSTS